MCWGWLDGPYIAIYMWLLMQLTILVRHCMQGRLHVVHASKSSFCMWDSGILSGTQHITLWHHAICWEMHLLLQLTYLGLGNNHLSGTLPMWAGLTQASHAANTHSHSKCNMTFNDCIHRASPALRQPVQSKLGPQSKAHTQLSRVRFWSFFRVVGVWISHIQCWHYNLLLLHMCILQMITLFPDVLGLVGQCVHSSLYVCGCCS